MARWRVEQVFYVEAEGVIEALAAAKRAHVDQARATRLQAVVQYAEGISGGGTRVCTEDGEAWPCTYARAQDMSVAD